ncbi:unnamed protein product [Cutaneotrichosporon oleaginosum]
MTLSYEEQRQQNIADNEALLKSLGLDTPVIPTAKVKPKPKPKPKPKAVEAADYEDKGSESDDSEGEVIRLRRSARDRRTMSSAAGTTTRVTALNTAHRRAVSPDTDDERQPLRKAQRLGIRTQDPRQFGHIPGVAVGTWWESRMDCSTAAVHAPPVSGISGGAETGAYSVALSGGYPDDVDLGEAFTYTGSGGRDLKGTRDKPKNLRTAPQTFDQSFDNNFNAALKTSAETKNPVRVIRGFKLESPYAPSEGYRYDGLYIVERAWMAPGLTRGLKVCKYAFKRLPGQAPLPRQDDDNGEEEEEEEEEEEGEEEDVADVITENVLEDKQEDHEGLSPPRSSTRRMPRNRAYVELPLNKPQSQTPARRTGKRLTNGHSTSTVEEPSDANKVTLTRLSVLESAAADADIAVGNGAKNRRRRRSSPNSTATPTELPKGSRRRSSRLSTGTQVASPISNGKRSGSSTNAEPSKRAKNRNSLVSDAAPRRSNRRSLV